LNSIYDILSVSPAASLREIKKAYAVLLKKCDQECEPERFQAIRQAYEQASVLARQRESAEELPISTFHEGNTGSTEEWPGFTDQYVFSIKGGKEASLIGEDQHAVPALCPAEEVIKELEAHYKSDPHWHPVESLQGYASSDKLFALQERERFEQLLLVWIFEPSLKIDWLDAATQCFAWDTANRHLFEWRPDLAWRVKRHIELLHLIEAVPEMAHGITDGQYYYELLAERELQGIVLPIPPSVLDRLARLLVNLDATHPEEARERFGDQLIYWKRIVDNERIQLVQARTTVPEKKQKSFPFVSLVWLLLVIIQMAVSNVGSSSLPPEPLPRPAQFAPKIQTTGSAEPGKCAYSDDQLRQILKDPKSQARLLYALCGERISQLILRGEAY